jgi:hypothetical protein
MYSDLLYFKMLLRHRMDDVRESTQAAVRNKWRHTSDRQDDAPSR